jgi:sirohydrochlorin cobaltochelatase
LVHTIALRRRGVFAEVAGCFWKEEPSLRDALLFFQDPAIEEVYVVPNFISEGYFTQTVIPRELELTGRVTRRENGQVWKYCEPVGNHPAMTKLLLQRAREVAHGVREEEISLLIVGHGTSLNDNSAVTAKREVEKIRRESRYAAVLNVYMEEAPLVADWTKFTNTPHVVVVPFFISDGLHSYEDIPVLLGIDSMVNNSPNEHRGAGDIFRSNPYHLQGRSVYYASSIGTDPRLADVIVEQTEAFEREESSPVGDFARRLAV